jgi:multiple sugar transport system substrate-binding protein
MNEIMKNKTTIMVVAILLVAVIIGALAYYLLRHPASQPVPEKRPFTKIIFASTQLSQPQEQSFTMGLLSALLNEKNIQAVFVPLGYSDMVSKLKAEVSSGSVSVSLIGGLSTEIDYFASQGWLEDLSRYGTLPGRTFTSSVMNVVEQQKKQYGIQTFVPWMTATFVIVVNNKAFDYLPAGLTKEDVIKGTDKWTWDALVAWAKNIYEKTGEKRVGLPAGSGGLLHRLIHGYLYVSYTGYQARKFNSPEAVAMWNKLKELWNYCHPESTTWSAMADPLLKGDVWIAWDHTARIISAIKTKPDDFTVVPVPRGPAGRGYILVLAGLAIPKGAPNPEAAWEVIEFLTRPENQARIAENVGFFPVVKEATPTIVDPGVKKVAEGVSTQMSLADGIPVAIPSLGAKAGDFMAIYRTAFERIVLKGEDASTVLSQLDPQLQAIFRDLNIQAP